MRCVFERHKHRFVVDCGKPSAVAIFLLPKPELSSFRRQRVCGQDHPCGEDAYKHLVWLWCIDLRSRVLCVDVKCAKILCCHIFESAGHFSSNGPKIGKVVVCFGPPLSHTTIPRKIHSKT